MKKVISYIVLLSLFLHACEINQKDILPEDGFTKIYNHPDESISFYPESVIELAGEGYLFLSAIKAENSEIEYPYAYMVKTNMQGDVLWTQSYENRLAPASNIIKSGNSIGFVAMNSTNYEASLITIDPATGLESSETSLDIYNPLYAFVDSEGKIVVLSYDYLNRSSVLSRYSAEFNLERSVSLNAGLDVQTKIQQHLNKSGLYYPFFIGEYDTGEEHGYFANCFYNHTLTAAFFEYSAISYSAYFYAFGTEEGISSLFHKHENYFGTTSYYEGNNFILPEVELDPSSIQNVKDMPSEKLYELTYKAKVKSGKIIAENEEYLLLLSQTNASSMVIYQYAMDSDSLVNTFYKNFDQSVEVNDFIQTEDQGIMILGNIFILGKHRRPLLYKMPAEVFIPEEE